mmetsp:Transcript_110762/g.357420  ORF Transcript_110762/g.357420 Transcript_110762/m.357420 type:complete len:343 (+) Transcript_110762:171-1199(+)
MDLIPPTYAHCKSWPVVKDLAVHNVAVVQVDIHVPVVEDERVQQYRHAAQLLGQGGQVWLVDELQRLASAGLAPSTAFFLHAPQDDVLERVPLGLGVADAEQVLPAPRPLPPVVAAATAVEVHDNLLHGAGFQELARLPGLREGLAHGAAGHVLAREGDGDVQFLEQALQARHKPPRRLLDPALGRHGYDADVAQHRGQPQQVGDNVGMKLQRLRIRHLATRVLPVMRRRAQGVVPIEKDDGLVPLAPRLHVRDAGATRARERGETGRRLVAELRRGCIEVAARARLPRPPRGRVEGGDAARGSEQRLLIQNHAIHIKLQVLLRSHGRSRYALADGTDTWMS